MPANKTSIEIEAKGEFSQLTRGLREVKTALGDVTKVVNTGARSGGLFTDEQLRSFDIFNRRFSQSMERMNRTIDDQAEKIASLYKRRRSASQTDISAIDKEIKKHGEYLDMLEAERSEIERIYQLRKQEAMEFGRKTPKGGTPGGGGSPSPSPVPGGTPGGGSGGGSGGGGGGGSRPAPRTPSSTRPTDDDGTNPAMAAAGAGLMGAAKRIKGIGGTIASIAGVALTINQLMKWEQMAEQNITAWQPLIQRTGVDRASMTNLGNSRGFDAFETNQMLDVYSQTAGRISAGDTARLMDFSRGYGVDANTAASLAGQMSIRGYGGAGQTLGMASGVASASGMDDRILEVLETSQGFLQSMDKNLKDNSGNSLLAYTARINQIGNEDGAKKLTGQAGASLLEQMGQNIFNPGNVRWQAMGINLLQRYGGGEVNGKNTFDLMSKWQEGFQDPLNVKVLGKYLADATKDMNARDAREYKTLVMQEALGGGTTVKQAEQFGELTDWLQAFDPNNPRMKALLAGGNASNNSSGVGASSDIGGKATQWQGSLAAKIEISNANWMTAQLEAGQVVIPTKLALQDFSEDMLSQMTDALNKLDLGNIIGGKLSDILSNMNWWEAAGAMLGLSVAGKAVKSLTGKAFKGITSIFTGKGAANAIDDVADGVGGAAKGASKIGGAMKAGSKFAKGIPLVGGLISVGANRMSGESWGESIVRGVGSAVGGYFGGQLGAAAGTLVEPGGGTVLGGIAGGILGGSAGDYVAKKGYDFFAGPNAQESKDKQAAYLKKFADNGTLTLGNLSDSGIQLLAELSKDGSVTINGMKNLSVDQIAELKRQGILEITSLNNKGANVLLDLQKSGQASLGGFRDDAVKTIQDASAKNTLSIDGMTEDGAYALSELQRKGEISIGALRDDGTREIKALNKDGADHLASLMSSGKISLTSMDTQTKSDLAKVVKTHEDFSKDMKDVTNSGWQNFGERFKNFIKGDGWKTDLEIEEDKAKSYGPSIPYDLNNPIQNGKNRYDLFNQPTLPGMVPLGQNQFLGKNSLTGANGSIMANFSGYSTRKDSGVTASQINAMLKGTDLEGHGQDFINAGSAYGIDPAFLVGLVKAEQNFNNPYGSNNFVGLTKDLGFGDGRKFKANDGQALVGFATVNDGLMAAAYNLRKYADGAYGGSKTSVEDVSKTWVGNDNYKTEAANIKSTIKDLTGHADGTYVSRDHAAWIHAGEELISRPKTAEIQRKTGKLPSQALSDYMSGGSLEGGKTGGSRKPLDININFNLTGGAGMTPEVFKMMEQMVRQTLTDALYEAARPTVQF